MKGKLAEELSFHRSSDIDVGVNSRQWNLSVFAGDRKLCRDVCDRDIQDSPQRR
jgi:hypothetical protein